MKVIGLCGLIGVGKTTVAEHLVKHHGYARVRFAGPLKDMARVLLSERQIDGDLKEAPSAIIGGKTPRQFMQLLGTEFGRQMIDEDLWINAWKSRAFSLERVVADDVRYPNEVEALKSAGGFLIHIARAGVVQQGHASETQKLAWDVNVVNDTTVPPFLAAIDALLSDKGLI